MTVKSSISLTDSQAAFARGLVEDGRAASLSAVVQQGLDLLRQKQEAEQAETGALKALLQDRAQGAFVGAEEFRSRTEKTLSEAARKYVLGD
ncbi:ribbon-helix-helix domain-containing protein [Shimia thalassica]|uniref:ribbon-helix-helix domain-containing protein n=1 Tax=Shimia thalassica TaxID=1715693 RepID=UPI002732D589|nr:type II toxin-antitoxin system ParD family antitoxin [Shimia thalassica]MDP2520856.1 type II toxin-antitoxin system ParD family antitoxin [Shimia thalassica]